MKSQVIQNFNSTYGHIDELDLMQAAVDLETTDTDVKEILDFINKNIDTEDKELVIAKYRTANSTVNDILAGRRNCKTQLGQMIVKELARYANINVRAKAEKLNLKTIKRD